MLQANLFIAKKSGQGAVSLPAFFRMQWLAVKRRREANGFFMTVILFFAK